MKSPISPKLKHKIDKIKMILMDVDGVLTRGGIILGNQGEEIKIFNIQDGMGVTLARMAGLRMGIITGRHSELVSRRARELKMDIVMQGSFYKLPAYLEILESYRVTDDEICYIGDDILDLDILERVGLSVTPANGRPEIKAVCDFATQERGGEGAVRKVIDTILKVQGKWDEAVKKCRWAEEGRSE
ncbi:HAD hydrolase family protein [bacterium]|nr:HAD hydrolase family protein [bacterium]